MAEFALFALLAVITTFLLLSLIPLHRTRTAATSAAYACAQFLSQSPDPLRASRNARAVAEKTLAGGWSGMAGARFTITVQPPAGPGLPGFCRVAYQAPLLFNLLGIASPGESSIQFVSRSETWKARWLK